MKISASFSNVGSESATYDTPAEGPSLSRVVHERRLVGELSGTSKAELQTCVTGEGRFGYVGSDRFSGHVAGRPGTFVFQHGGVREGETLRSFGFIVPGSGTGELAAIRGSATIMVSESGEHILELDCDWS